MTYKPEQVAAFKARICRELADGLSLKAICDADDMPSRETVYQWLHDDKAFSDSYARAREEQADHYADDIIEIADTEPDPQKARVRIDARKWVASKLKPGKYGDKVTVGGDPDNPVHHKVELDAERFTRAIAGLAARSGEGGSTQ